MPDHWFDAADADRPVVRAGNKRGRPSNLARQAAAAAAAAAAQLRDGDQASPRSQNANPAADRDGLSQVIMLLLLRSMGAQCRQREIIHRHGD